MNAEREVKKASWNSTMKEGHLTCSFIGGDLLLSFGNHFPKLILIDAPWFTALRKLSSISATIFETITYFRENSTCQRVVCDDLVKNLCTKNHVEKMWYQKQCKKVWFTLFSTYLFWLFGHRIITLLTISRIPLCVPFDAIFSKRAIIA